MVVKLVAMPQIKLLTLFILAILISLTLAADATPTFKQTLPVIKQALRVQNFEIINQQIALNGIVSAKIKRVMAKTNAKPTTGRNTLAHLLLRSEPLFTKLAVNFIRQQYSRSSPAERNMYVNSLVIKKVFEKPDRATAHGSFKGNKASFYGKKIKGQWVIVGIESAIIDQEIDNLLKLLLNRDTL